MLVAVCGRKYDICIVKDIEKIMKNRLIGFTKKLFHEDFVWRSSHHLSYWTPKNAPKYMSYLYLCRIGAMGATFATPGVAMACGPPTCNEICVQSLPEKV